MNICDFIQPSRNNYVCLCHGGHRGRNCEMNDCNPNPCENGGNCSVSKVICINLSCHNFHLQITAGNGYSCTCATGYIGSNCQINVGVQECERAPCMNGGTCHNITNDYNCECSQEYEAS